MSQLEESLQRPPMEFPVLQLAVSKDNIKQKPEIQPPAQRCHYEEYKWITGTYRSTAVFIMRDIKYGGSISLVLTHLEWPQSNLVYTIVLKQSQIVKFYL